MVTIRNWQDVDPYVGHETAIIWPVFRAESEADKTRNHEDDALFITRGISGFTRHLMQSGKSGDYHDHEKIEQNITTQQGDKMTPASPVQGLNKKR